MNVTVNFFSYAPLAGTKECVLELAEDATLADLTVLLAQRFPKLIAGAHKPTYLVNQSGSTPDTRLQDGDEVLMLQVFAGG
jgi:molybdopterin converting factor small subunit